MDVTTLQVALMTSRSHSDGRRYPRDAGGIGWLAGEWLAEPVTWVLTMFSALDVATG
jgi:hypothetical protein